MKIIFDTYEADRAALPMAPANTATAAAKPARRTAAGLRLVVPRETRLFHAWRA